jgi:hypothetical protein
LIEANVDKRSSLIEQFINQINEETSKTQLSMEYYSTLVKVGSTRRGRAFARRELAEYLRQAEFYFEYLTGLPKTSQMEALRMALDYHYKLRFEAVSKLLTLFDSSIDYEKLLQIASTGEANAEAEATEVVKGVVGGAWADRIIALAKQNGETIRKQVDSNHLIKTFRDSDSSWILAGLLLSLTRVDYSEHRSFVQSCLNHKEGAVRETALQVFIAYESERKAISDQCEISSNDTFRGVAFLAKQTLGVA